MREKHRSFDNVRSRLEQAAGAMSVLPQPDFHPVSGGGGLHGRDLRRGGGYRVSLCLTRVEYYPLSVCLYHAVLLLTLLCTALIEADEKLAAVAVVHPGVGRWASLCRCFGWCRGWDGRAPGWDCRRGRPAAIDGLAVPAAPGRLGGAAWWALGCAAGMRRQEQTASRAGKPCGLVLGLGCGGLFLGWEAAAMHRCLCRGVLPDENGSSAFVWPRVRFPRALDHVGVVTLAWILFWRGLFLLEGGGTLWTH